MSNDEIERAIDVLKEMKLLARMRRILYLKIGDYVGADVEAEFIYRCITKINNLRRIKQNKDE